MSHEGCLKEGVEGEYLPPTLPHAALKILVLSDLHSNKVWYDWVKRAAPSHHLVAIAGDLLDGRSEEGLMEQMLWVREWANEFPTPLAVCSGNHDANSPSLEVEPLVLDRLSPERKDTILRVLMAERWMDTLEAPGVSTDNRSQVVHTAQGKLVVSTIPYDLGEGHDGLWRLARILRNEHRCPWIVLHHDPPRGLAVGGPDGSPSLREKITDYRPDYVFSGHLHHRPYEGSFAEKVAGTWCFNPGFAKTLSTSETPPNHVVLNISEAVASWCATWEGESSPRVELKVLDPA